MAGAQSSKSAVLGGGHGAPRAHLTTPRDVLGCHNGWGHSWHLGGRPGTGTLLPRPALHRAAPAPEIAAPKYQPCGCLLKGLAEQPCPGRRRSSRRCGERVSCDGLLVT